MRLRQFSPLMVLIALLGIGTPPRASAEDPPGRIGRVSYLEGSVSFRVGSDEDWADTPPNDPVTTGAELWSAAGARAEVHVGSSAVRLAPETLVDFVDLSDDRTEIRLAQGSLYLRVRAVESGNTYQVDTPEGTISLLEAGRYRIDVSPYDTRSTLTVRDGDAEVSTAGGTRVSVRPGESVALAVPSSTSTVVALEPVDDWERWCGGRDQVEDASVSLRYISPGYVGFEALGDYGTWEIDADFGPVWVPTVAAGWAPYRFGQWSWMDPWGWTWIDADPWGFAPFHYGRWAFRRNRWAWVPGEIVAAPVYAPALVAFVGGSGFDVSLSFGAGGGVGWFPLAPGEAYVPAYRVSQTYVRNVNITSVKVTDIDVRRLDVAKMRYANRAVPGAVTAVPRETFLAGTRVDKALVRLPESALSKATVLGTTAPIARAERPAVHADGRGVARPPASLVRQPVVSRPAPTPARGGAPVERPSQPRPEPAGRSTSSAPSAWTGPADPAMRREWQAEREQALARQSAEGAVLERRQRVELSAPRAEVSPDDLRQRQNQERDEMARRHRTETDAIDGRYRGRQG